MEGKDGRGNRDFWERMENGISTQIAWTAYVATAETYWNKWDMFDWAFVKAETYNTMSDSPTARGFES